MWILYFLIELAEYTASNDPIVAPNEFISRNNAPRRSPRFLSPSTPFDTNQLANGISVDIWDTFELFRSGVDLGEGQCGLVKKIHIKGVDVLMKICHDDNKYDEI